MGRGAWTTAGGIPVPSARLQSHVRRDTQPQAVDDEQATQTNCQTIFLASSPLGQTAAPLLLFCSFAPLRLYFPTALVALAADRHDAVAGLAGPFGGVSDKTGGPPIRPDAG
jgi:hypothetical protein